MDQDILIDRHLMRRKLRWWRIATILITLIALAGVFASQNENLITRNHIARIEIFGVIQDDDELVSRLKAVEEDEYARALILTISSPGGTTYGGERIYKAIKDVSAQKPVIADVRTLAASAGYMIATGADHIVAGDTSIVGSIGVIFQYPQVSKLLENIGVSFEEIKSSPLKAEPSPFHPASEEAVAMINSMIIDSYDWFVDIVAENRNLTKQEALKLADGSIYTGRQALQNGLIDAVGGEMEIRAFLKDHDISAELDIIDHRPTDIAPENFFSSIFEVLIQQYFGIEADSNMKLPLEKKLFLDGLLSVWQFGAAENRQ